MVCPEEAGIGSTPASRANAASRRIRPLCDQESSSWGREERPDAGLVEELGGELLGERLDLAGALAFFGDQLSDPPGAGAERAAGGRVHALGDVRRAGADEGQA